MLAVVSHFINMHEDLWASSGCSTFPREGYNILHILHLTALFFVLSFKLQDWRTSQGCTNENKWSKLKCDKISQLKAISHVHIRQLDWPRRSCCTFYMRPFAPTLVLNLCTVKLIIFCGYKVNTFSNNEKWKTPKQATFVLQIALTLKFKCCGDKCVNISFI